MHDRRPTHSDGLIHYSDRGSQYVSTKYTDRLAEAVEYATLDWVWTNHRRLLKSIGSIPPTEAEERYYATIDQRLWSRNSN